MTVHVRAGGFKSSGYDKLELKHNNLVFFKLIECIIQKKIYHGVKQYAKMCHCVIN